MNVKTFFKFSCIIYNMNTKFSTRLKELRLAKGITQKELGKAIGATYSAVSYWEKGINEPKLSFLIALCNYFEVSADYFLGISD